MTKVIDWIKRNKLASFLIVLVLFLLVRQKRLVRLPSLNQGANVAYDAVEEVALSRGEGMAKLSVPVTEGSAPAPEVEERMVVEQSSVSLLVDDVKKKADEVINYADQKGGYMVSSSINQPQEAPFATVVVRIPSNELRPALEHLRNMAIKVTSENLMGQDVTDQYVDLQAKLATLNKTKTKFEQIMDQAVKIDDILRVQRELISLQSQIDSVKGREKYLEKTAENAKLTIYLSTDEWSLPYAPQKETFRPKVIFKQAVRSLVFAFRLVAKGAIWLVVYSVIWLPILLVIKFWRKKRR